MPSTARVGPKTFTRPSVSIANPPLVSVCRSTIGVLLARFVGADRIAGENSSVRGEVDHPR
jgi:hypothetical protein